METRALAAETALESPLYRVLKALARIALRHGMGVPAFVELTKRAFVDVAHNDFSLPGRKPSDSRVSVLTGLTRKEVHRLLSEPEGAAADDAEQHNRAARVVAGWGRDAQFHDDAGSPPPLPFDEGRSLVFQARTALQRRCAASRGTGRNWCASGQRDALLHRIGLE